MTDKARETEELAIRLFQMVDIRPWDKLYLGHKERWIELAKEVQRLILQARIDEIESNMTCDSERLNKKRIAELTAELKELNDVK